MLFEVNHYRDFETSCGYRFCNIKETDNNNKYKPEQHSHMAVISAYVQQLSRN